MKDIKDPWAAGLPYVCQESRLTTAYSFFFSTGAPVPPFSTPAQLSRTTQPKPFSNLQDLIGERTPEERMAFLDYWFLRSVNTISGTETVKCVRPDGKWGMHRDLKNKGRGDGGSIDQREASLRRSGFLKNRTGPALFARCDEPDDYDVGHFATLLQGGEQLYNKVGPEEFKKLHKTLKRMLEVGIDGCKVYQNMPDWGRSEICDYGNLEQDVATGDTPLQKWEKTIKGSQAFEDLVKRTHLTVRKAGGTEAFRTEHL